MARQSVFSFTVDATELVAYSEFLGTITPEALGDKWVKILNSTADTAYDLSRRAILSGINLTDSYVQRKMKVRYATSSRPAAEIIGYAGKENLTNLSHYGAMQRTQPNKWTKYPRKGHAALGIPVGQKAAGVSVEVVKGNRKEMGPVFRIPGKKDRDGNLLLFRRTGQPNGKNKKGRVEALIGPSVYQLFRVAIPKVEDETLDILQEAVLYEANRIF